MKYLFSLIISGALVVSGFGQTRNVLVGTNNAVVQPTNFWSADAVNARSGLGLGTAATNPASAFQPSSLVLSNLASSNAVNLTNLRATNVVGTLSLAQGGTGSTNASDARTALGLGTAATNPASAFQSSSSVLTNIASGNGGSLTNLQAASIVGVISTSNIPAVTLSTIGGTLSIESGGTGATNAANARQNLGVTSVGDAVFTATNATAARTAIGALATNGSAAELTGFVGTTNPATARTNLGLGWSALTNTDATNFRNAIGLGATNVVRFESIELYQDGEITNSITYGADSLFFNQNGVEFFSLDGAAGGTIVFRKPILFLGTNASSNAAVSRTNLGLPWSGLTNTNAATFQSALFGTNTNPVLVNTSGSVVSPTNFWQVAPITTTFIESQPTTNQTTNIAAGRNLHIHSIAFSTVGITNTIALPTTNSFNGDIALVVHQGPTSSVTAVRTAGAATNLITLNQFDEAVEFVYYNNVWQFNHNRSFIEPIYFSGTNATANAAASRTNLSLGATWLTNTDVTNFRTAIGLGLTNSVEFAYVESRHFFVADGSNGIVFETDPVAAITRTNLGIPLPALTNTNNANFQAAVFATNSNPTNGGNFNNHVAWMEVTVQTNGSNVSFRVPLYK